MSRKDVLRYNLNQGVPQSLASSFTTAPTAIKWGDNISYQITVTTSNSTGTFAVQASNDYCPSGPSEPPANPGNWVTLSLGGGTPTVNAANDIIVINLNQLPFMAVRLVYTPTIAGTGTADMWITSKQLGG